MAWNQDLTGKALAIAGTVCKYLRVMAGPGTGKTYAMKRRVARLLEEGVPPDRLLVVTFTRVAAASLVTELGQLGVAGCSDINAGTLHSFCFRILNLEQVFEFVRRVPRPLVTFSKSAALQFEASPLLADISENQKREGTKRIRAFEAAWARLQSDAPGWPQEAADRRFHDNLSRWLTFHRSMLIGELVPEVLKYLRNNPGASELSAFDHVIVDEYQDLNRSDQVLLDLLTSGSGVIIGDENQSIYRFRYAHPEGIIEFGASHDPTHDEDLDECRRCPTRVVALANSLIMKNHPGAAAALLRPKPGNPEGKVNIVQWQNMEGEALGIAKYIARLISEGTCEAGEILILSPRRNIAYGVRDALKDLHVPAHSFYHEEALEEDKAQEAFAYLTLLADQDDRVALRFLLGFGSSTWLAKQYAKIRKYSEQNGLSPKETLEILAKGEAEVPGSAKLLGRYKSISTRLATMQGLTGSHLVNSLFPENAEETKLLRESITPVIEDDTEASAVLDRVRNLITQPEMPEHADFVRIMSLQKSKGLTSKAVIVMGCVEGLVPFIDSDKPVAEQEEVEREQRRLFYVAITRPTDVLVISSFAAIDRHLAHRIGAETIPGIRRQAKTIASRFLAELGPTTPVSKTGTQWEGDGFA
jgi:DNA helicase II / ATP-dependent DNA helicase PcrA